MESDERHLSLNRQADMERVESARRHVVGYAKTYPAGLATGMHSHGRAHLLYAISGVMHVDTESGTFLVPPTTAVFLPAHAVHSVQMDDTVEMRALFFQESAATRIGNKCFVIAVSPLLREVIVAACKEGLDWESDGKGLHLAELALYELASATRVKVEIPLPRDRRLQRVISALLSHPNDTKSREDWAEIANASGRTLARLFRSETGLSFRQWRQQMRLVAAMNAISTGSSLAKAAEIGGFSGQPAFGAAFRSLFGMTPGEARALYYPK
jgi:AraC-like DNA-binding protein/quercetin dioxygenase-like cupin family protein